MSLLNIKNLKVKKGCKINVWCVNVDETPYTRIDLFKRLKVFKDFCALWHIDAEELLGIVERLYITDNSLFDYTTCGSEPYCLHISNGDIYTEKWVHKGISGYLDTKYYSLYICASEYVSLSFNKIANSIVKSRFPYFFHSPFGEIKPKFDEEIIDKLPINVNATLSDIDFNVTSKITIADLINLYTVPGYDKTEELKSLFTIYGDGNIFLSLDKEPGHSLYLKVDDLFNKDWKSIEEKKVYSIPIGDKKFFEGMQKDAPYFSHPLVGELKKYILGT